jgi:hypothetical protein
VETLLVDGWTVRHDGAATVAYYQRAAQGDTCRCLCSGCRNFALQRSTAFPAEFLRLLDQLGIDPKQEHEAYEMGPASNGLRCYGGWLVFIGHFSRAEIQPAVAFDDTRFSFGFTDSFPWAGDPPREAVSAVGFYTPLRWLLPDEDPD